MLMGKMKVTCRWSFTFSKPAPEASPVMTLGISFKCQVRTSKKPAFPLYYVKKDLFKYFQFSAVFVLILIFSLSNITIYGTVTGVNQVFREIKRSC